MPAKFASCHDLRRSLAQRLRLAGVDRVLIMQVVRHEDWDTTSKFYAPGELQRSADELWKAFDVETTSSAH